MDNHSCIIGLLHFKNNSELCTVEGLNRHIADGIEFNALLDNDPVLRERAYMRYKIWTLQEYADKRRSTDLRRFEYCPDCGKRIDLATLKEG